MATLISWLNALSTSEITALASLFAVTVVLKRAAFGVGAYALIAWPGTVCHELAHALVGFLLRAQPCNMTLYPKNLGGGHWQLGSVAFRNMRWWNAPWTAMAPLLLAPLSVWLTLAFVIPVWEQDQLLSSLLGLVLSSVILQASWPSTTDFKVAFPGLLILGSLAWLLG